MTTDTTRLVLQGATQRDASDASGDAARVTYRTLQRGNATTADREAHVVAALVAANLTGEVETAIPAGFIDPATGEARQREWDRAMTPQRLAVLRAFREGLSYTESATALHLNVATVKSHAGNLYRIFGVSSKVECVVAATRAGVLPPVGGTTAPPVAEAPTEAPTAPRAAPTEDDLAGMSRPDLQGLAREMGLRAGGTAAVLRARILAG